METRHAHAVPRSSVPGRTVEIESPFDRASTDNCPDEARIVAPLAVPSLRLHGRDSGGHAPDFDQPAEPADSTERARAAHRLDPRRPALRFIRDDAAPVPAPDLSAAILRTLAASVGTERFARLLDGQVTVSVDGLSVTVCIAGKAGAGVIERRLGIQIHAAAEQVLGKGAAVRFTVADLPITATAQVAQAPEPHPSTRATTRTSSRPTPKLYRLEEFVVGPSNRLAFDAILRIADATEEQRSATNGSAAPNAVAAPLFIHGPCGVGKTHLLAGLAQRYRERQPGAIVRLVAGETFLNEFIMAVRHGGGSGMTSHARSTAGTGGIERFRRTYRRCDLLCIDDVHFLASKQATQQELLHTFDQIAQSGAKVVLACDRHPRDMKPADNGTGGFSTALVSRFLSGMVAAIDAPDPTVRDRAARLFAQRRGLVLEDSAARLLVERTQTASGAPQITVRDLEGLITRVEAVRKLAGDEGRMVGALTIERALGGRDHQTSTALPVRRPLRAEQILAQTCIALGVDRSDLGAPTRHKRVVLARAVITYLCRELTTMSFPEIARAIGRPSHSTVITAFQRLQKQIAAGEVFGVGPSGEAMTVGGLVRQLAAALTKGP